MQWLNDEVINLFLKLLDARDRAKPEGDGTPRCHFLQSNFYTKLAESHAGYDYTKVRRWTKKVDVFARDLLIVPIHCHGNHWALAVVNLRDKRFEYFDSLRGSPGATLKNLRRWLEDEHQHKKNAPFDASAFSEVVWKHGTPEQHNGYDCGVFMTRTADYIARDGRLDFTQDDMEYFRRRMVFEILHCRLLP